MMSQDLLMTDDDCASHVKAAPDEAAKTAAPQGHSRSGDDTPVTTTFFHELLNRTRNRRPALAQPAHTAYHLGLLAGAVNPAARKPDENPISYKSAFAAELTTVQALDLHESRIYQKGYTPEEIRHTIKFILRQISPGTHMVNFRTRDIPPQQLDPQTHMVLTALLAERDRTERELMLCLDEVALDGTKLEPSWNMDAEFSRLDSYQNDTNRTMYQVYSDSKFLVHDNNFLTYCRPHLRNLSTNTAFELQELRTEFEDAPPYRLIQEDPLPEPTVPRFLRDLGKTQPSASTPPLVKHKLLSDAAYHEACAWMFGTTEPTMAAQEELMLGNRAKASPDKLEAAMAMLPEAARPVSPHVTTYESMESSSSVNQKDNRKAQTTSKKSRTTNVSL
jgi:hypothetical protein